MSVKIYAVIFGILFLVIGILGFLPEFTPNGYLFNVFSVHPVHNWLHIITGVLALLVAFNSHYARIYFRVFAVIYLFIALLAFLVGSDFIFMRLNHADNLFHLIVGAIFLYLGFGKPRENQERRNDDRIGRVDRDRDLDLHRDRDAIRQERTTEPPVRVTPDKNVDTTDRKDVNDSTDHIDKL